MNYKITQNIIYDIVTAKNLKVNKNRSTFFDIGNIKNYDITAF